MHRAICIPDIVELILSWLERSDAVRLGRTCRILFGITMDTVWKTLNDLEFIGPLLNPPPLWLEKHRYTLIDKPKLIPRARAYLAHVRILDIQGPSFEFLTDHFSPSDLFPNITSLTLSSRTVAQNDRYHGYLLPGITNLSIKEVIQRCGSGGVKWEPFVNFLGLFKQHPKRLETFELELIWPKYDATSLYEVSAATRRMLLWHPELIRVNIVGYPDPLLASLGTLPQLQELELLFAVSMRLADSEVPVVGSFKSLKKIKCTSSSSETLGCVLASISSPHLEDIEIKDDVNPRGLNEDGSPLAFPVLPAIVKHTASLRRLNISHFVNGVNTTWSELRPLLECHRIEDFEFLCESMRFTDDDVDDIVKAWPLIKRLYIKPRIQEVRLFQPMPEDERTVRVSCRGLQTLSACSHLLSLCVPLCLTNPPDATNTDQATPRLCPLHILDIRRALFDVDKPQELEHFLRTSFPRLRYLRFERQPFSFFNHPATVRASNRKYNLLSILRQNLLHPVSRHIGYTFSLEDSVVAEQDT
ncbi:hypothetical protein CALCODRAFT_328872 [Calocera cornea HHB12733]|uniref:F-box domain-containing protein n=1 Tax=Calocera cornea HHB12733 TaxID=1353952 RepID=A0A165JIA7_9BASI|nr:hypothetical protein CALCODRAFT_328872 [Calocera cornea HHB12733]